MLSLRPYHNARYAKLGRQVGKVKFVVEKTLDIASRHFRAFARLEVVRDEIVRCEEVVQILRETLFWIRSDAQDISIAAAAMRCQPCFAKVWANVRQKNVAILKSRYCPGRRQCQ